MAQEGGRETQMANEDWLDGALLTRRACFAALAALAGAPLGAAPVRVPTATAMKKVRRRVDPIYPSMARGMGIEGSVTLDAVIDAKGNVEEVTTVDGHPVLANAAQKALKEWKFEALSGSDATSVARFEFRFQKNMK